MLPPRLKPERPAFPGHPSVPGIVCQEELPKRTALQDVQGEGMEPSGFHSSQASLAWGKHVVSQLGHAGNKTEAGTPRLQKNKWKLLRNL